MPRLSADAPDLAISPDGAWLARLDPGRLQLFRLAPEPDQKQDAPLLRPVAELSRPAGGAGQIGFLSPDRLLHVSAFTGPDGGDGAGPANEAGGGLRVSVLALPSLQEVGTGVTVPGTRRILAIGPAGAVVAPLAAGAEIISWHRAQLSVEWASLRGDVLSAVPAPEGRWLIEQRGGYEVWDPGTRRVLARLTLATRQAPAQLGFIPCGRLIWALGGGAPVHLELFRSSDGRQLCEIEQPGRALRAEAGLGRLVIAADEGVDGLVFLDVDVGAMEVRRIKPPDGVLPQAFTVRPMAGAAEIVVGTGRPAEEAGLLRLPLVALPGRRPAETEPAVEPPPRRPPSFRRPARLEPQPGPDSPRPAAPPQRRPPFARPPRPAVPQPDPVPAEAQPVRFSRPLSQPVPRQGSFQAELLRWARQLFSGGREGASPPEGEVLTQLGTRLSLSPAGLSGVALLYAAQQLCGGYPQGLPVGEVALLLGDEVLAEVLPSGRLRLLGLAYEPVQGSIRLHREVIELLAGAPCPGLYEGRGRPGEALPPGLHHVPGDLALGAEALQQQTGQPVLLLDLSAQEHPLKALRRGLRRALLRGAVLVATGPLEVSFLPGDDLRSRHIVRRLQELLSVPPVPVLVCATEATLSALGLSGTPLSV